MTPKVVTPTGTIRRMSRRADVLPSEVVSQLQAAVERRAQEEEKFRDEVVAALKHGSVRKVAEATGLSPTTVQAWSALRKQATGRDTTG